MKLLYAEDEPALSEAVVDYLTYHKYIVDAVYDGADAYDYAMSGEISVGEMSFQLPKQEYRLMEQFLLNHRLTEYNGSHRKEECRFAIQA